VKSNGTGTEPCGTAPVIDIPLSLLLQWSDKYDLNHANAIPLMST